MTVLTNLQEHYSVKVSLNAASCQMADSTVFIRMQIEPEEKGIKKSNFHVLHHSKMCITLHFCALCSLYLIASEWIKFC